uniref:NADH dehydrogenase subunit 6 n=1 Tax=Zoroaster ophiactis TaxID=467010 RepID=UPI002028B17B|nr:NADH dehydrogenase subunit 6 [Zoroaster ophiactis]UPP55901.1 NADH dehydrogenase subunit 6 [Zoroaster ophiactis]
MIFYSLLVVMFFGSILVFYSLSPYYGALGLVLVAVSGCILCSLFGMSFVALILLLIYVGGMMVVFVYSTALSAERYPIVSNIKEVGMLFGIFFVWIMLSFDVFINVEVISWNSFCSVDLVSSGLLYGEVWYYLVLAGYILLVALIVALVMTYGSEYNVLKAL